MPGVDNGNRLPERLDGVVPLRVVVEVHRHAPCALGEVDCRRDAVYLHRFERERHRNVPVGHGGLTFADERVARVRAETARFVEGGKGG